MSELRVTNASFGIGAVLAMSLEMLGRSWLKFAILSLLPWIIVYGSLALAYFVTVRVLPDPLISAAQSYAILFGIFVSSVLVYAVCQAAITQGVAELLRGRRFRFGRAFRAGISRFGLMFGIGVLMLAIILGFGLAAMILTALLPRLLGELAIVAVLLVGGSLVSSAFFVVLPIAAMEDHNAPGCFARSRFLTRGYRWPIFGLGLVMLLGYGAVELLAAVIGQVVLLPRWAFLVPTICWVGVVTLANVTLAVSYFRLRLLKEGVGLDSIAAVFD